MPTVDEIRTEGEPLAMVLDQVGYANAPAAIVLDPRESVVMAPAGEIARLTQAALKRTFDFAVSAVVLLLALPLIALTALLVRIESPGPVFYRAERIGRGGRKLQMLKFRKMHHNASGAPLTMSEDDRFTRVGRFLARTKIDELPQLWHVLCGEMSLIGPRPEDPRFVAERFDDYSEILKVRPGVTGLSQIAFA